MEEFGQLVSIRSGQLHSIPEKSIQSTMKESPTNELEIIIDEEGHVKIGENAYGLDALKTIIRGAKANGYQVKVLVEPKNKNFLYIDSNQYCLCNNYKNDLTETNVMVDLGKELCTTFIKTTNTEGETELKPIDGLILIRKDFAQAEELAIQKRSEKQYYKGSRQKRGMQASAIQRAWNLAQNDKVYIKQTQAAQKSALEDIHPDFDIWGVSNTPLEEKACNEIVEETPEAAGRVIVELDQKKCIGCGECVEVCPHEAIVLLKSIENRGIFANMDIVHAQINTDKCFSCGKCAMRCPVNAISIKEWCKN